MNILKHWMTLATAAEQKTLAKHAKTSRAYLHHLANGERDASADMAGKLEEASKKMRKASKYRLPILNRSELCLACSQCPYARKCVGK